MSAGRGGPVVLVTGSTGLLGKGLEETLPDGWRMTGVHLREYGVTPGCAEHLVVDVSDRRQVDDLFTRHRFEVVIHAAGIANVDYVEAHYAESLESNLIGTFNVLNACRRAGCRLVYVSTNAVFDGTAAPYREEDPVAPINKYGHLKVECERLVRETLEDAVVVRPILMYGWPHPKGRANPAAWLIDRLKRGERVHIVDDVVENPLYNRHCAEVLWEVVRRGLIGTVHVAGAEAVSRYELALTVADVFGLDRGLITRVDSSFFPSIAPRPRNTSFVTERIEKELGVTPLTVEQGLSRLRDERGRRR